MSLGASGSSSSSSAEPTKTYQQIQLINELSKKLRRQTGEGVSAYPDQITPGASGLQSQAFSSLSDILGGGGQYSGLTESGEGALQNLMKEYDPTLAMQSWEKSVKEPAMRTWKEEMVPQILESYGGQNALESSGLKNTLSRSGTNLASDISGQLSNILLQEKNQASQNQLSAAGLANTYSQTNLDQIMQALAGGTTERGITSEQMQEPYQKWLGEQAYNNPWLINYLGTILGTTPAAIGQTSRQFGGSGSTSFGGSGGSGGCSFVITLGEGGITNVVRLVRDYILYQINNKYVSKGYKEKFAFHVVPAMKKSKLIFNFFRFTMTKPISIYCRLFIERKPSRILFIPLGLFWLFIFNALGGGKVLNIPKTARIMLGGGGKRWIS